MYSNCVRYGAAFVLFASLLALGGCATRQESRPLAYRSRPGAPVSKPVVVARPTPVNIRRPSVSSASGKESGSVVYKRVGVKTSPAKKAPTAAPAAPQAKRVASAVPAAPQKKTAASASPTHQSNTEKTPRRETVHGASPRSAQTEVEVSRRRALVDAGFMSLDEFNEASSTKGREGKRGGR